MPSTKNKLPRVRSLYPGQRLVDGFYDRPTTMNSEVVGYDERGAFVQVKQRVYRPECPKNLSGLVNVATRNGLDDPADPTDPVAIALLLLSDTKRRLRRVLDMLRDRRIVGNPFEVLDQSPEWVDIQPLLFSETDRAREFRWWRDKDGRIGRAFGLRQIDYRVTDRARIQHGHKRVRLTPSQLDELERRLDPMLGVN